MKILNNAVDKIITRLGTSNDSEICTAALAAFKLIFMPFATMSDKKSTKKQKSYALTRDILTEKEANIINRIQDITDDNIKLIPSENIPKHTKTSKILWITAGILTAIGGGYSIYKNKFHHNEKTDNKITA